MGMAAILVVCSNSFPKLPYTFIYLYQIPKILSAVVELGINWDVQTVGQRDNYQKKSMVSFSEEGRGGCLMG